MVHAHARGTPVRMHASMQALTCARDALGVRTRPHLARALSNSASAELLYFIHTHALARLVTRPPPLVLSTSEGFASVRACGRAGLRPCARARLHTLVVSVHTGRNTPSGLG